MREMQIGRVVLLAIVFVTMLTEFEAEDTPRQFRK
jgi:hypothetical protein